MSVKRYKIVRRYSDRPGIVTRRGLTLEQAQAHCQDPSTSGVNLGGSRFMDTYDVENPTPREKRERLEADEQLRAGITAVERLVNPR